MFQKYYTFDDVALVPQYNNVPSRTIPKLDTWLTRDVQMKMPFVAANMDTVIGDDLATVLVKNGIVPIFHRFAGVNVQLTWVKKFEGKCFISCGLNMDKLDDVVKLLDAGALGVCIDIAHGHSEPMITMIKQLKKLRPKKQIIAGNVCTPMAFSELANAGADAVKVGVGGGSPCSTRMVTGFGTPQFTTILECAKVANKLRVPLIADGGIRNTRDMVLALAAGASSVMMGSMFTKTLESAAKKVKGPNGKMYARYRGQASKEFQDDYYGKMKKGTVAEGVAYDTPCTGTCQELLDKFSGALRSGLTYGGAKSIKELQRKAEFVAVTSSYMAEAKPRMKQ